MSFTDTLKRSLGFEESENANNDPTIVDRIRELASQFESSNQQRNVQQQYDQRPPQNPNRNPNYRPQQRPVYDDFEYIVPEQSLYEIVLIRPKTIDEINYVVDQVIEENNPVILDLSFLEKESPANFKLAGDKIKVMRARYGAQALLLSRSIDKNLIIISPKKIKVTNKG